MYKEICEMFLYKKGSHVNVYNNNDPNGQGES